MKKSQNVYSTQQGRLQDVITAIQVLGSYETTTAKAKVWRDRIGSSPVSAGNWEKVFTDHPEFFRTYASNSDEELPSDDTEKIYSLVLRRSQPRMWLRKERRLATVPEITDLKGNQKSLTWEPLSAEKITSLIEVAVKLHGAEWTHREKSRWWIALFTASAGFLGALAGAFLKG